MDAFPGRDLGRVALAVLVPLGALALVAPYVPLPRPPAQGEVSALAAALAFGITAGALLLAAYLVPAAWLGRARNGALVVGAGLALAALSRVVPPAASGLLGSLAVVLVASVPGAAVGERIAHPGHLLAVALTSTAVDLWSVYAPRGVTHAVVQQPVLLELLTLRAAIPPERAPSPMIGFGDVVFAVLYLSVSRRFGLGLRRTTAALGAGLLAAGVAAMTLGLPGGVPALPFLGFAVVLAHREARSVPPGDRRTTLLAAALVVAAVARVAWLFRHGW
ncbi:MAG: hypothetical protein HY909_18885 [Deltaproteobacteria bacterium]|nr:hypothetical protein [Deltaproteobacteria bacterium]